MHKCLQVIMPLLCSSANHIWVLSDHRTQYSYKALKVATCNRHCNHPHRVTFSTCLFIIVNWDYCVPDCFNSSTDHLCHIANILNEDFDAAVCPDEQCADLTVKRLPRIEIAIHAKIKPTKQSSSKIQDRIQIHHHNNSLLFILSWELLQSDVFIKLSCIKGQKD